MEDQYFFESIDQIQATAEPTRWQILNLLITRPMTGSQLARVLGIPRPLAHYHLKILEKVGLVAFQEERLRGGVVEKYFRAIARQFRSDHLVDGCRTSEAARAITLASGSEICPENQLDSPLVSEKSSVSATAAAAVQSALRIAATSCSILFRLLRFL
jgi:DNA-binding transcriptional ArsR family regulator